MLLVGNSISAHVTHAEITHCKYLHNILDTFEELTTPTYNNCTTALRTKSAILKCILEERKKVVVAVVVSLYTYVTLDLQFGAF